MPKYTIYICDLTFLTIVGILEDERKIPQKVKIDLEIEYTRKDEDFINYAQVATLLQKQMQKEKYLLLEEALEALTDSLKLNYPTINTLRLKIFKPEILDNCDVGVEIFKIY